MNSGLMSGSALVMLLWAAMSLADTTGVAGLLPPRASATLGATEALTLIFNGLTSLGTIAVAVLAIFGQRIRNHFVRPKLRVSSGEKPPFAESMEIEEAEALGNRRVVYQLRLGVQNEGRESARRCKVYCDRVYAERAGGTDYFPLKEFVPARFYWTSRLQEEEVLPNITSYVNVVEISSVTVQAKPTDVGSPSTPTCALQVQVEAEGKGAYYRVASEHKKILVPVVIQADNIPSPIVHYLEVTWQGKSLVDLTPGKLQIRLLDKAKGEALVGSRR